jgi:putative mRNA 3-end processing factor
MKPVIQTTPAGLYCPAGDFYIDPWRPVPYAVITHAHSDHARHGSDHYLAVRQSGPLLRSRLGSEIRLTSLEYGERLRIGRATVSLHPAGHILGSAQIRIEVAGEVWVITGDYKREADPTCHSFEPLKCHGLITESTFGIPVFRWPDQVTIANNLDAWWRKNILEEKTSLIYAYALGKSQRLLAMLDPSVGPIFLHGAQLKPTEIYRELGIDLPPAKPVSEMPKSFDWRGSLIVAVPSAAGSPWQRKFQNLTTAMASGWMHIRGHRRRRNVDRGFVLSDHADWPELLRTVQESEASEVWVTHGYADILARYLQELGYQAKGITSEFLGELDDPVSPSENSLAEEVRLPQSSINGGQPD